MSIIEILMYSDAPVDSWLKASGVEKDGNICILFKKAGVFIILRNISLGTSYTELFKYSAAYPPDRNVIWV